MQSAFGKPSSSGRFGATRREPAMRWPLRSVLSATLLTVGTYLLLPSLEMLSDLPRDDRSIRSVDTVDIPAPPPLPPPKPKRAEPPDARARTPKPTLAREHKLVLPLSLAMNLDMALGDVGGDFDLDFGLSAPVALEPVGDLIFELADLDEPPRPLVRLRPIYPAQARMRQIEGTVVLEFIVRTDGRASDIEVVSSSPGDTFDQAAVRAVKRWRFTPGARAGEPVPARVRQKISFRLEE